MRLNVRGVLVGAGLVGAIAVASGSAVLFSGGDSSPAAHKSVAARSGHRTTSTTTSSTTTTSTTTTTTLPPLDFAPPTTAPAPAPTTSPPAPQPAAAPAPQPAPQPAPAPPPPPAPAGCSGGGGVVGLTNADRAAAGLPGLCVSGTLTGIAQNWANHMAATNSLAHQSLSAVIGGTGFSTMGENILVGPAGFSINQMETAWMNSPDHRANILNGAFTQIGVGIATSGDGRVWACVDFGG